MKALGRRRSPGQARLFTVLVCLYVYHGVHDLHAGNWWELVGDLCLGALWCGLACRADAGWTHLEWWR